MAESELICDSINGMRIRQSLPQPYISQTGTWFPGRRSSWELEFRDCGIPVRGLLLTAESQIQGM